LPFDGLKIDCSLVEFMDQDNEQVVLVKAMIARAHNLKVAAEDVARAPVVD